MPPTNENYFVIGEGLGVYSNLDGIKRITKEEIESHTKRCISLHYKKDLRYVRLSIQHYFDKKWDLDVISTDIWEVNPYLMVDKLLNMSEEELMQKISLFPRFLR